MNDCAPPELRLEQRRELQLGRLQWSLRHAYDNVTHYRQAFDDAGVHPDAVPREQVLRIHASSGTTGQPTVVGYTRHDTQSWAEVMARSIQAAGGRPGDIVHVAYGYGLFSGGLGLERSSGKAKRIDDDRGLR